MHTQRSSNREGACARLQLPAFPVQRAGARQACPGREQRVHSVLLMSRELMSGSVLTNTFYFNSSVFIHILEKCDCC